MIRSSQLVLLLTLGQVAGFGHLHAQTAIDQLDSAVSNPVPLDASSSQRPGARATNAASNQKVDNGPPVPVIRSPVDFFRKLLAMNPAERQQFLSDRPAESQRLILAKVREYESLRPNERELRLRATELRWYLWPLMGSPPTNRVAQLALIPEEDRQAVEIRLRQWDKLPPTTQAELLTNEFVARWLTEIADHSLQQQQRILKDMSEDRRKMLEAGIARWNSLSREQRARIIQRFNDFFRLNPEEQEKALSTLSEAERQQIERTLHNFRDLPSSQRIQCIQSFQKFTSLSLAERQQFLKNADRWKRMSPDERQAWRDLVDKLPPMPPGFDSPPLPPGAGLSRPPAPRISLTNAH